MSLSTNLAEPIAEPSEAQVYRQRFAVPFEYDVCFTRGVFDPENSLLAETLSAREPARRQRFAAFVDANVARSRPSLCADVTAYAGHHAERLHLVAPPETVPGGEAAKNDPALVARLQARLMELGIDRQSHVVAVGGGAMLDLMGFVAATVHRGIRLTRVPTTVLAQNDSGVGVKNGVNAFGQKNFIGTFAPPFTVLNDLDFIESLEPRDRIAGMAEAVKVALIRDAGFFKWLEANSAALVAFEPATMETMIRRCAELHMRQIAAGGDPFEMGSARPLDFGHWAAHRLEVLSRHDLRHGEAVAIGIALDSRYSVQAGLLPFGDEIRICRLLERLGLPLWHPALETCLPDGGPAILRGLSEFREHLGGELTVTLLAGLGRGVEVHEIDGDGMLRAAAWLKRRTSGR